MKRSKTPHTASNTSGSREVEAGFFFKEMNRLAGKHHHNHSCCTVYRGSSFFVSAQSRFLLSYTQTLTHSSFTHSSFTHSSNAMISSILLLLLTIILVGLVSASSDCRCLTDETASVVAYNFQHLFQDYSPEFVDTVLAVDFTDQTDSVAWLMSNGTDCPKQLGAPTITGIDEFNVAQSGQPNLPFPILNIYHNCDSVCLPEIPSFPPAPQMGMVPAV